MTFKFLEFTAHLCFCCRFHSMVGKMCIHRSVLLRGHGFLWEEVFYRDIKMQKLFHMDIHTKDYTKVYINLTYHSRSLCLHVYRDIVCYQSFVKERHIYSYTQQFILHSYHNMMASNADKNKTLTSHQIVVSIYLYP